MKPSRTTSRATCFYTSSSKRQRGRNRTRCAQPLPKIALEEAFVWPSQTRDDTTNRPVEFWVHEKELQDVKPDGKRAREMKKHHVVLQVLSTTAQGLQHLGDPTVEGQVRKAREVNDYLHEKVAAAPSLFRGFASLPMRSPAEAARELRRCVTELGFVGALVNGADTVGDKVLYYDTPDYDVLWKTFVELDVPLYLHPAVYTSEVMTQDFSREYPMLVASAWGFSAYLAQHVLRLVMSGVFDRFPRLQLILGHMGEFLPWWAERLDHRLCMYQRDNRVAHKSRSLPRQTLSYYLRHNILVTTSGFFSDDALMYVIKKMGVDRVLFSIDYPYETHGEASRWMDRVPLSRKEKEKVAYANALRVLKLAR